MKLLPRDVDSSRILRRGALDAEWTSAADLIDDFDNDCDAGVRVCVRPEVCRRCEPACSPPSRGSRRRVTNKQRYLHGGARSRPHQDLIREYQLSGTYRAIRSSRLNSQFPFRSPESNTAIIVLSTQ